MTQQETIKEFDIETLNMAQAVRDAKLKKKISVKTVYGKPDPEMIPENGALPCVRMVGGINKMRTGEGNFGPWVAFKGQFIAVNLQTGESFKGSELFLPDVASDLIESAVIEADGNTVNIAFDIEAIHGRDADDYQYVVKPHMEVEESDPLLMLASSLDARIQGNISAPVEPSPEEEKPSNQDNAEEQAAKEEADLEELTKPDPKAEPKKAGKKK